MSLPSYSRFLALLAHEAEGEPPPKPGQRYVWDCGCRHIYRCGDWEHTHKCPRHAQMVQDVREQMLRGEVGL